MSPIVSTSSRARTLLVAGGVAFSLVVSELAVRALVPAAPRPRLTEPPGFSPFEQIPEVLYVYKPGSSFAHVYDAATDRRRYFGPSGRIEYRINGLGLRGRDVTLEKPAGMRRVLCLGDSFTFGEGVREEDSWPERLGRALGTSTQVVNAGIQGYDLDREMLYLFVYGRQLQPDAVVLAFFMNDAMPFGETVAHQELLTETHGDLSPLGRVSALWRFVEGRRFATRQTSRYLSDLRRSFSSPLWHQAKTRIPRLREMADHDGFRIVAMIFPLLYRLDDYPLAQEHAEVRRAFEDAQIEVVDLLEAYRGREASDLWVHVTDPHPNEIAHAMAAERIAGVLAPTAR